MRCSLAFLAAVLALGFGAAGALGQPDVPQAWTRAASATTEELWGVTWGGGQFVAVGKGGAIVTSSDGLAWTARQSGTTAWLLAVVYDAPRQRYFVVGDAGVLLTSTDAVTWTPLTSGTQQRLNGIAVGGGRILAVGENSTVVTSTDGQTWSVRRVAAPGWLRGVAYFDGAFVLGGRSYGEVASTMPNYRTTDGLTFTEIEGTPFGHATEALAVYGDQLVALSDFIAVGPAGFPIRVDRSYDPPSGINRLLHAYIRGVALLDNRWIAAGSVGTVIWGEAQGFAKHPHVKELDRGIHFNAVAANAEVAVAVGSQGGIVQTTAAGPRAPVIATLAPRHQAVVAGAALSLQAGAAGSGPIAFQWFRNGSALDGANARTLVLPAATTADSGSYVVTATNTLGTSTSGSHAVTVISPVETTGLIDPTFAPQAAARLVLGFGNGSLLLTRSKPDYSEVLYRVDAAGVVDPSFTPLEAKMFTWAASQADGSFLVVQRPAANGAAALIRLLATGAIDPTFTPIPASSRFELLHDGRILRFDLTSNVLRVQRHLGDGQVDTTYPTVVLTLAAAPKDLFTPSYSGITTTQTADGWLVAVSSYSHMYPVNSSKILSFDRAGAYTGQRAVFDFSIVQLVAANSQVYFVRQSGVTGRFGPRGYLAGRLTPDFEVEFTYVPASQYGISGNQPLLLSDGSLFDTTNGPHWYDAEGRQVLAPKFNDAGAFGYDLRVVDGSLYASFQRYRDTGPASLVRMLPLTAHAATRLTNVSVRQQAGLGEATLTLGFALSGTGNKPVLLRAVGPTLADFGVSGTLADPTLSLWDRHQMQLLASQDWWDGPPELVAALTSAGARVGAFALPDRSRDAAVLSSLPAGTYTMQVNTERSGVALAEAYDTAPAPTDPRAVRLVNVSARGLAGRGDQTLILGFAVEGPGAKRILLRGIGPSLVPHGVSGVISDPIVTVFRGDTVIAWNDDMQSSALGSEVGAFPLTSSDDAALILTLPNGVYTVQVTSADGGLGIALAELYELP